MHLEKSSGLSLRFLIRPNFVDGRIAQDSSFSYVEHVHARPLRDLFIGSFFELPGAGPEEEKSLIHPPWERYVNN